jgi:L-threonylcarbamoyladenylate synthase
MKYKHYAPAAQLILLDGEGENVIEFLKNEQERCRCAILCYDEEASLLKNELLLPIGEREDVQTHAKMLFARLRECDSLSPDVIYAHIPDRAGLGLALYNRMIRAAAHTVLKI